jgi:hypothetical protein
MRIRLHVDRMSIEGLALNTAHGAQLQAAIEVELSRLLVTGGIHGELANGGSFDRLDGGRIQTSSGAAPRDLGAQIARAMYGCIGE